MRDALLVVGIAALIVIAGAWYAFSRPFGNSSDTESASGSSPSSMSDFRISSSAFAEGASIPKEFTCDGARTLNPPLTISGVPESAKSLVLLMDDPDVPKAVKPNGMFDHWVLFNISPETKEIGSGQSPGVKGANGAGQNAYTGPCPPPQYEPSEHRYFFKLYALDVMLDLKEGASKDDVEKSMQGHVIAEAQLIGRYSRK